MEKSRLYGATVYLCGEEPIAADSDEKDISDNEAYSESVPEGCIITWEK